MTRPQPAQFQQARRDRAEREALRRERHARGTQARLLREQWCPIRRQEEEKNLAADIVRLIQSGEVTVYPPSNHGATRDVSLTDTEALK